MKPLVPCLWFDTEAEEAMNFYTSVFKNSKKGKVMRWGEGGPRPAGIVLTASFELNGQEFLALNGGPQFKFTEAVSFQIPCDSQDEVDYYWDKLIGRRRKAVAMRLAEGQVRSVVAGLPDDLAEAPQRYRSRQGQSRHASDDADGQDR